MKPWEIDYSQPTQPLMPWEIDYGQAPMQAAPPVAKEPAGFLDRVGQAGQRFTEGMEKRGAHLADVFEGDQTIPETILQTGGHLLGTAGDVIAAPVGLAAQEGYRQLPKGGQDALKRVGEVAAPYAQAYERNLEAYNVANPRMGRNLQAVREFGNLLPLKVPGVVPAIKATARATRKVSKKGADVPFTGETLPIIKSDTAKAYASESYKLADEKGGVLKPEITDKFLDDIIKLQPQSDVGKIVGGDSPFMQTLRKFTGKENAEGVVEGGIRGKPISLQGAQELDEMLGDFIDIHTENGVLKKQGKKILDIQDSLRETIEGASEASVTGGKEGFKALKEGRANWSAAMRLKDIEKIFSRASKTDNEATSIKAGFRTLSENTKRMRGYTRQERKLIEQAAKSSFTANAFRTVFGSRLLSLLAGGASGGFGGAAAGVAASSASRGVAKLMQGGRGKKVQREISKRVKVPKKEAQ